MRFRLVQQYKSSLLNNSTSLVIVKSTILWPELKFPKSFRARALSVSSSTSVAARLAMSASRKIGSAANISRALRQRTRRAPLLQIIMLALKSVESRSGDLGAKGLPSSVLPVRLSPIYAYCMPSDLSRRVGSGSKGSNALNVTETRLAKISSALCSSSTDRKMPTSAGVVLVHQGARHVV